MKNLITLASLTLLLTACGGGPGGDATTNTSSTGTSTATGTGPQGQNPDTSPVLENTAELKSSADFDFSSSRAIAIDFDVAAATTSQGMLSLCTKYSKSGDSFDIDYDSCAVQAPLVNGVYSSKMDITNDINSVVGVVWFADSAIAPIYKEFSLEVGAKLARRGESTQSIVWR
jgi:hypothetical protein